MAEQLAKILREKIKYLILQSESEIYKYNDNKSSRSLLYVMNTLNYYYKSLILDSDKNVTDLFSEVTACMNHSEICLLNIMFRVIHIILQNIDRSKLDNSTYLGYIFSLNYVLELNLDQFVKPDLFSHECNGDDIKECDPNIPLFYAKIR